MKLAKNFAATALLVFAISLTSYGGDQQTPGATVPPPPPEPPRTLATTKPPSPAVTTAVTGTPVAVTEQMANILWYEALLGLLSIY